MWDPVYPHVPHDAEVVPEAVQYVAHLTCGQHTRRCADTAGYR